MYKYSNSIELVVNTRPIPKGRPRFCRNGHAYTPKRTVDFEKVVRNAFLGRFGADYRPMTENLCVSMSFAFVTPKKCLSARPISDLDNLAKAVLDSLNKIAFDDDVQVVKLTCDKHWGASDSITLTITPESTTSTPQPTTSTVATPQPTTSTAMLPVPTVSTAAAGRMLLGTRRDVQRWINCGELDTVGGRITLKSVEKYLPERIL